MQSIDLQTTQNVTIEYELAALGERMLAMIIDILVVGIGYFLLLFLSGFFSQGSLSGFQRNAFLFIIPLGCFLLYHFLCELLTHGQSLGKRALSIQVVRLDGEIPVPGDYLLRALFLFVDLITTVGILGALLISSTPKRQRVGDLTAGTSVIKMRPTDRFDLTDIQRISSLENYQPIYTDVRQFSEQDMLLIKNAIASWQRYPNAAHEEALYTLAQKLAHLLEVPLPTGNPIEFMKTLIRDYIVLTR